MVCGMSQGVMSQKLLDAGDAAPRFVESIPMGRDQDLIHLNREQFLLFHQRGLDALLVPPRCFAEVEDSVGSIRATAFRQVSPFAPAERDLDGRDQHYWHLLVCDHSSGRLLGAQRLSFSRWQQPNWGSDHSYLEHCYPGLQHSMESHGLTYLEVGRVFVSPQYRDDFRILPTLMRASGLLALDTAHRFILGLMSYRFVAPEQRADWAFLQQINQPPFSIDLPIPPARHPLPIPEGTQAVVVEPGRCRDLDALSRLVADQVDGEFTLPGLIRIYSRFSQARVAGLSVARDFNQIVEVLMCNDSQDQSSGSKHPGLSIPHQRPWLAEQPLPYLDPVDDSSRILHSKPW